MQPSSSRTFARLCTAVFNAGLLRSIGSGIERRRADREDLDTIFAAYSCYGIACIDWPFEGVWANHFLYIRDLQGIAIDIGLLWTVLTNGKIYLRYVHQASDSRQHILANSRVSGNDMREIALLRGFRNDWR